MTCLFGHKWNGCKCKRCGETRDEKHNWNGCKCSICGTMRDEQHDWNGCKCSVCGTTRDEQHDFKNSCTCFRCGCTKHSFAHKDWNVRLSPDWGVNTIIAKICERCGFSNLIQASQKIRVPLKREPGRTFKIERYEMIELRQCKKCGELTPHTVETENSSHYQDRWGQWGPWKEYELGTTCAICGELDGKSGWLLDKRS